MIKMEGEYTLIISRDTRELWKKNGKSVIWYNVPVKIREKLKKGIK